jgi:hypothetical protein
MSHASRWDSAAIRAGATVALLLAVPLAVAARIAAGRDDDTLAVALSIGATLGFLVGAGWAAWVQRVGFPLSHGLVTAAGAYVAAQVAFIAVRLVRGQDVRWFGVLFTLTFVLFAGLLGGLAGQRLRSAGIEPPRLAMRKEPT